MPDRTTLTGIAAPLPLGNLDTDQIMPKQFLKRIDKEGLAQGVLYDMRHDEAGNLRPGFVLNQPPYREASILVAGPNFGCGSSREHAVWGLLQYGIQAIIASSFGEIFYSNAMNNRLLLVILEQEQVEALEQYMTAHPGSSLTIDLSLGQVRAGEEMVFPFQLSARHRQMFMEGLDMVGATERLLPGIEAFEARHWQDAPWLRPRLA